MTGFPRVFAALASGAAFLLVTGCATEMPGVLSMAQIETCTDADNLFRTAVCTKDWDKRYAAEKRLRASPFYKYWENGAVMDWIVANRDTLNWRNSAVQHNVFHYLYASGEKSRFENRESPLFEYRHVRPASQEQLLALALAAGGGSVSREAVSRLTSPDALAGFSKWTDAEVLRSVAGNTNTPARIVEMLADHPDKGVVAAAAGNPLLPPWKLSRLAASCPSEVAWNTSTPAETLARLAMDSNPDVIEAVALNPSAPMADRVRCGMAIVGNKLHEKNEFKWKCRLRKLSGLPGWGPILWERTAPPEVLSALISCPDEDARLGVAKNPATPVALLNVLADSKNHKLRTAALGNPNVPYATLLRIAKRNLSHPGFNAALNSGASRRIVEYAAQDHDRFREYLRWFWQSSSDIEDFARTVDDPVVQELLANWTTNNDSKRGVQSALVANPNASPATLSIIAKAPNVTFETGMKARSRLAAAK